ncbi:hypothetical protein GCM10020331_095250 [Ectobacillus funiculus]
MVKNTQNKELQRGIRGKTYYPNVFRGCDWGRLISWFVYSHTESRAGNISRICHRWTYYVFYYESPWGNGDPKSLLPVPSANIRMII